MKPRTLRMGVQRMELKLNSKSLVSQWLKWSLLTLEKSFFFFFGPFLYGSHLTILIWWAFSFWLRNPVTCFLSRFSASPWLGGYWISLNSFLLSFGNNNMHLIEFPAGLNEMMFRQHLAWCLPCNKHSVNYGCLVMCIFLSSQLLRVTILHSGLPSRTLGEATWFPWTSTNSSYLKIKWGLPWWRSG